MTEAVEAPIVEKFKVGYDRKGNFVVLVLESHGRRPVHFVCNSDVAAQLGRALLDIDTAGKPTPLRLS